jgi:rubrerythrin
MEILEQQQSIMRKWSEDRKRYREDNPNLKPEHCKQCGSLEIEGDNNAWQCLSCGVSGQ